MTLKEKFDKSIPSLENYLTMENGDWTVKGFIDIEKNIYTISTDTKVVSKIVELMIFPLLLKFAVDNNYTLKLTAHQNYYPDLTLIDNETNKKYAIDLKSTYRIDSDTLNGFTLGAFTGYFRNRNSTKNITFPYNKYEEHYVLGIIYTRTDLYNAEKFLIAKNQNNNISKKIKKELSSYLTENTDNNWEILKKSAAYINDSNRNIIDSFIISEKDIYNLDNFTDIQSVVRDFKIFFIEKWKIATDKPGSGNTKNIGSIKNINDIINGRGTFSSLENGKTVFDDYWQLYETKDMATSAGRANPLFKTLATYQTWKNR